MYFVLCRPYHSSPNYHGNVLLLPVISLLLANAISLVRACISILYPKLEVSRPDIEFGPPRREASNLEKSHSNSLDN
jgi:hypothetical protein